MKFLILIFITTLTFAGCKEEPCKNTTCLNGGVCIDGNCDCPDGWEGVDCSDQLIPNNYYIKSISLQLTDLLDYAGEPWDIGTIPNKYPDLDPLLWDGVKVYELLTSSGMAVQEDAEPYIYHEFKLADENALFSKEQLISINILDRYLDGEPYESTEINKFEFYPYDESNKANTRTIVSAKITLKIELEPVW